MKYRVLIHDKALTEVRRFLRYIAVDQGSPLTAERWWEKSLREIDSLQKMPHRCFYAPENDSRSKKPTRMLLVDRCLFLYRVDEESKTVRILRFRHGSQLPYDLD